MQKEADGAGQLKLDELSMKHKENPFVVDELVAHIQDLQGKVSSFNDATEFCDPETALPVEQSVSRSSVLRNTTDFFDEGRLLP